MWLVVAILGYLLLAIVFVLDKRILTNTLPEPSIYTFYSTIFMLGALLVLPIAPGMLYGVDWLWAIVSGVTFGFALWAMFVAVKHGEASHMNPFIGAVMIFSESLSSGQIAGMCLLIVASLLLSYERTERSAGFHRGFLWAIVSGVLFSISHVSAKYLYTVYPFATAFIYTRATTGLVGVALLLAPAVRASFRKKNTTVNPYADRHPLIIVAVNKIFGIIGVVLVQWAIALGSVTLVNALASLQYVFMFVCIVLLTKFAPRFLREYFTPKEYVVESIALGMVLVGSFFFIL
jgi:drug/metabolite transporter (DMT)-like permease